MGPEIVVDSKLIHVDNTAVNAYWEFMRPVVTSSGRQSFASVASLGTYCCSSRCAQSFLGCFGNLCTELCLFCAAGMSCEAGYVKTVNSCMNATYWLTEAVCKLLFDGQNR